VSARVSIRVDCPSCGKATRLELEDVSTNGVPRDTGRTSDVAAIARVANVAVTYRASGEVDRAEGIEQALSMLGLSGPTVGAEGKKVRREIGLASPKAKHEQAVANGVMQSLGKPSNGGKPRPEKGDAIDRVLIAAAWMDSQASVSAVTLAVLSRYSPTSSSFVETLALCVEEGWLNRVGTRYALTPFGRDQIEEVPSPPTEASTLDYLSRKLGKCPGMVIEKIVSCWIGRGETDANTPLSKGEISALTNYSVTSSSFHEAFSELLAKGLIEGRKEFAPTHDLLIALAVGR